MKKTIGLLLVANALLSQNLQALENDLSTENKASPKKQNSFSDQNIPLNEKPKTSTAPVPSDKPSISISTGAAPANSATTNEANKPKPIPSYEIKLISPTPEQAFHNEAENVTVTVSITPQLEKEDTLSILLDGKVVGEPSSTVSVTLPALERGEHTIQAKINQPQGKGATTEVIKIYKIQPSVANKK